jgi:hypothetical protein
MADPPPATAFMKVVVVGMIVIRLDQRHYTVCSCESMSRDKNLTYTCQHQKLILVATYGYTIAGNHHEGRGCLIIG